MPLSATLAAHLFAVPPYCPAHDLTPGPAGRSLATQEHIHHPSPSPSNCIAAAHPISPCLLGDMEGRLQVDTFTAKQYSQYYETTVRLRQHRVVAHLCCSASLLTSARPHSHLPLRGDSDADAEAPPSPASRIAAANAPSARPHHQFPCMCTNNLQITLS